MNTAKKYSFADLLNDLQSLTPEQLAQPVMVWGENINWGTEAALKVAANDYACYDGEAWEIEPGDESEGVDDILVIKGQVFIETN